MIPLLLYFISSDKCNECVLKYCHSEITVIHFHALKVKLYFHF